MAKRPKLMSDSESPEVKQLREDGKREGLDEDTIQSLIDYKVKRLSQILHFNDKDFEKLNLPEFIVRQLKEVRDKLKKEKKGARMADQGSISVSNVTIETGHISGHSSVGAVSTETMNEDRQSVEVEKTKMKTGNIDDNSRAFLVEIRKIQAKPKDLVLQTTDKLIAAMSDGPLSGPLKVQSCSQEFYFRNKKEAYSMEKKTRGGVLIINVDQVGGHPPRYGTDIDRDKLEELFQQLHFNVTVYNDDDGLTKQGIQGKVQAFADDANEEQGEAYVVCLLSHGQDDCLYGTDGELLAFDTIFSLFGSKRCPNLVGKPKMFFIQACRVGEPRMEEKPIEGGGRSDMIVSYATQAGYEAFRNTKDGSWLVEAITKVFAHFAHEEDIVRMMYRVHYAVQKKLKDHTAEDLSPEVRLSLGKPLFFFPGIQK